MKANPSLSRRDFLKVSSVAGVGLVIGLYVPACSRLESAPTDATPTPVLPTPTTAPDVFFSPNVFVNLGTDGTVTVTCPRPDMGQGTRTALPMILAEELGVDWPAIRIEQADADTAYGDQSAAGSTSIETFYMPLRKAGALARKMLVRAAADTWDVTPEACSVQHGIVTNIQTQEALPFSVLVRTAMAFDPNEFLPAELKDPKDFTIIGTSVPRVDGPDMVTGKAVYGMDVRVPDMLYAAVARCPVFRGQLISFDDSEARKVSGVVNVLEITSGSDGGRPTRSVAVLAHDTWSAIRGRDSLKVQWDEGPSASLSGDDIEKKLLEEMIYPPEDGELVAYYTVPFFSHSTMEPINSTVRLGQQDCEAWAPTQNPQALQKFITTTYGMLPDKARVHVPLVGGAFGRRIEFPSFSLTLPFVHLMESAELSKAAGVPVKVVWTRDDDMHFEYFHPLSVTRVAAALTDIRSMSVQRRDASGYGIPTGAWRAVTNVPEAFARQSFVDEFAVATKQDPIELRRQMLGDRQRAVLDLAVKKSGWGSELPPGHGRGIAIHSTWDQSPCAEVAQVVVDESGRIRVLKVTCAIDCGVAINPDMVKAQLEGGIIFGLTAALKAHITIDKGRVVQSNFHDYPLLKMNEVPEIETFVIKSTANPTGTGEMANPPVAAAVANAVYAATGKRIRRLPILPEGLVAA